MILNELCEQIQCHLQNSGQQVLSRTSIGGRTVLRAVLQNPLTGTRDLAEMLAAVRSAAEHLAPRLVQEMYGPSICGR